MVKSPDAFRSIGEVSRLIGVAPHVLRYWEGQFSQLAPIKRADGRRYYRPDDVRLAAGLCQVMREEGLSIRGAKRLIAADRGAGLRAIGAARLGESLPAADGEGAAPTGPAVRLAWPGEDQPSSLASLEPLDPQPLAETPPPSDETSGLARNDPAPCTADTVWLARLTTITAALRAYEERDAPLSASTTALRDRLRALR